MHCIFIELKICGSVDGTEVCNHAYDTELWNHRIYDLIFIILLLEQKNGPNDLWLQVILKRVVF